MSTQKRKYYDFGKRLKKIRELAGLTQPQFAKRVGCGWQNISKLERDASDPSETLLKSISHEFDVAIEYLTEGKEPLYKNPPPDDGKVNEHKDEFGSLNFEEKKKRARAMLDDLFEAGDDEVLNHIVRQLRVLGRVPPVKKPRKE